METARRCGFTGMGGIMGGLADQTPKVIEAVERLLPRNYPESIAAPILAGLKKQAGRLALRTPA